MCGMTPRRLPKRKTIQTIEFSTPVEPQNLDFPNPQLNYDAYASLEGGGPVQGRGRGKPLPEGRGEGRRPVQRPKPPQPRGLVGFIMNPTVQGVGDLTFVVNS